jgi:hypothetical protein
MEMSRETSVQKMVDNYPALESIAEEVIEFIPEMHAAIPYDVKRGFDVISANFLMKQRQHLKAILALKGNRDALLIVRTMVEGLVQVIYFVRHDRDKLAARWRKYTLIESWRAILIYKRMGLNMSQEDKDKYEGWAQAISKDFLTVEAMKALKNGEPLPEDPYVKKWLGLSISEMFKSVKLDEKIMYRLYQIYDICSSWHHWSPKGLAMAMIQNEEGMHGYHECRPEEYIMALETGVMCMVAMAESSNDYFQLNYQKRIIDFRKRFNQYKAMVG